jgi:acyl-homoserine lactone acylase PvdQ
MRRTPPLRGGAASEEPRKHKPIVRVSCFCLRGSSGAVGSAAIAGGRSATRALCLCVSVSPWLTILCVLCSLSVVAGCRGTPPPAPLKAQVSGSLDVAGLSAPVRVVRDRSGVPHIYAASQDDLFFAQGLVQAQDRLFQMDLWRRSVQGRLSEVLGPNFVERDAMTRRMQYRGDVESEWASYGGDTKAIASAFVRGINAWVALARERPPEEFVLAGWTPEPWAPEDLLTRTDAFVESGDAIDEVFRARLVAAVGASRADALLPAGGTTLVPAGLDVATISPVVADAMRRVGTPPFFMGLAAPVIGSERRVPLPVDAPGGRQPDRDATFPNPAPRYLVHLNAPGWNVIGATPPWFPGVAIGHNDRVAWNAEPFDADTQDVFVEKLNPSNPHQVDDHGRWVDTEVVSAPIVIRANPKPFVFETEYTRHGVIVASDRTRHLAFAVRWSGTERGAAGALAALALDRAESAAQFTAALARWKMPARRFTYQDVDGVTGSRAAALVPIRRGWNGALPAPAWSGRNEWTGWEAPDGARHTQPAAATLARWARAHPDRADALLSKLAASAAARDAMQQQRGLIVDALADAIRDGDAPAAVVFAHPLGITSAARRRFSIGPLTPAGRDRRALHQVISEPADWDRSTAMNAPGQSGSPDSAHFSDLAARWTAGESIALPYTDAAVQAAAESTLTLTPRPPSPLDKP